MFVFPAEFGYLSEVKTKRFNQSCSKTTTPMELIGLTLMMWLRHPDYGPLSRIKTVDFLPWSSATDPKLTFSVFFSVVKTVAEIKARNFKKKKKNKRGSFGN